MFCFKNKKFLFEKRKFQNVDIFVIINYFYRFISITRLNGCIYFIDIYLIDIYFIDIYLNKIGEKHKHFPFLRGFLGP